VPKKLVQAGAMEGLLGLMASPDWLESLQVPATRRERGGGRRLSSHHEWHPCRSWCVCVCAMCVFMESRESP